MATSKRCAVGRRSIAAACLMMAACSSDTGPGDDAPGTDVVLSYCDDMPLWLAVQDGDGPWTRLLPVGEGQYEFAFKSERGGVATVLYGGSTLQVNYGSLSELATIRCAYGYKYLTGKVSGLTFPQRAGVSLGASGTTVSLPRDSFQLWSVLDGPQDLFASRRLYEFEGASADRVIIRRALDPPANSKLATLNFDSTEAFAPVVAGFSVTNVEGAQSLDLFTSWYGRGAAVGRFYPGELEGATSGQYTAVPLEQLAPGDLSSLDVFTSGPPNLSRSLVSYFRTPVDMAITLGPALSTPTVTYPATGGQMLPRVQLPSQVEYGRMVSVYYQQNYDGVTVTMTSAYMGGTPATWDLQVPDLSSVDGWSDGWGLVANSGIVWSVSAEGGADRLLGDVAHEGDELRYASIGGSNAAAIRLPLSPAKTELRRGGFPRPVKP